MIRHIDQILDENKPVWVRNIYKPKGQIVLAMHDRSGQVIKVVLPPLKHPVCLSDRITPETIRHSTSLRDLISRKVLELVAPADAQSYYETNPHAREDVERAFSQQEYGNPEIRKMRETGKADDDLLYHKQGDAVVAGKHAAGPFTEDDDDGEIGVVDAEENGDVQPRVKVLMEALANREKKAREVRSDLEALDLTDADLAYVVAHSQGLVEKFAKQELSTRRGQGQAFDSLDDSEED